MGRYICVCEEWDKRDDSRNSPQKRIEKNVTQIIIYFILLYFIIQIVMYGALEMTLDNRIIGVHTKKFSCIP